MVENSCWKLNINEYHPYYKTYIRLLDDTPILTILENQITDLRNLADLLTEEKARYRYAEGKWSVKEVIGHMIDTERIFAARAVAFARNEKTDLPGYDQDDYVREAAFNDRTVANLHEEFYHLRKANIAFFSGLNENELMRKGKANNTVFTVRTVPYVLGGHFVHHIKILKERYF